MSSQDPDQATDDAEPASISVKNTSRSDSTEHRVHIHEPPGEDEPRRPKGILKAPTTKFPDYPETLEMTGSFSFRKEFKDKDIPPGARWTKIDRRLVNPEALEEAKERFEERLDCVIVLRVLTKEEIQRLADRTRELRDERYEIERASFRAARPTKVGRYDGDAWPAEDEASEASETDDGKRSIFDKSKSAYRNPKDRHDTSPPDGSLQRSISPADLQSSRPRRSELKKDSYSKVIVQDAYSYTDPAGMYATTEPKWRKHSTPDQTDRGGRGSSMFSAGPPREQPNYSADRARHSAREIGTSAYTRDWGSVDRAGPPRASVDQLVGPPPSRRGWDKINDIGARPSPSRHAREYFLDPNTGYKTQWQAEKKTEHKKVYSIDGNTGEAKLLSSIPESDSQDLGREADQSSWAVGDDNRSNEQVRRYLGNGEIQEQGHPDIGIDRERRKEARNPRRLEGTEREQLAVQEDMPFGVSTSSSALDSKHNNARHLTGETTPLDLKKTEAPEGVPDETQEEMEAKPQAVSQDLPSSSLSCPPVSETAELVSGDSTTTPPSSSGPNSGEPAKTITAAPRALAAMRSMQPAVDDLDQVPHSIEQNESHSIVNDDCGEDTASFSSITDTHTVPSSYAVSGRASTLPTSIDPYSQPQKIDSQQPTAHIAASIADPGLDAETSAKLMSLFVDDFLANLRGTPGLLPELAKSSHGAAQLIREYARLKATAALTSVEQTAANVVRYRRHDIAANVRSTATTMPSQDGVLSLADKLALLWAKDRPDRPDDFEYLTADDELDDILPESLREQDVREALTFLFASQEYRWLLRRMKLETMMSTNQPTYTLVREQLIDAQAVAPTTTLKLNWSPRTFVDEQFETPTDIGSTICLVGDESGAYATTCRAYIELLWPDLGPDALILLASALTNGQDNFSGSVGDTLMVAFSFGHDHTVAHITGPAVARLEVSEVLVWLAAACRTSPSEMALTTCMPIVQRVGEATSQVAFTISGSSMVVESTNLCWLEMFSSPVVVSGYPIPQRSASEVGLEVPLAMMVELGQAFNVVNFANTTILKGFASLFVPTLLTATSIVWHFLLSPDGSRLTYNDGADATTLANSLELETLQTARHFVGWTVAADQLTGSNKAGYAVRHSRLPLASPATASLSSASLSVSKIVGGSLSFVRGKKDIPATLKHSGDYLAKIESAGDWTVVLYDIFSRRAWLSDGASVLLYICRSWLHKHKQRLQLEVTANEEDEDNSAAEAESIIGAIDKFRYPNTLDGKPSAIHALYNKSNRNMKMSKTVESKIETVDGKPSTKDTTTWSTWQTVVEEKFTSLEIIYDHIIRSRLSRTTTDVKMPFRSGTFEGYEFNDVVSGTSTLQPHEVRLLAGADDWLKWCISSHFVPLVGSDFGELIRPAAPLTGVQNQSCAQYGLCPPNLDYLAAPISILKVLSDRMTSPLDGNIVLGPSCVWNHPVSSFRRCRCKCGSVCEIIITKLNDSSQRLKKHISATDPDMIWKECGRGAVVFGSVPNRLTKVTDEVETGLAVPASPKLRRSKRTISDSGVDLGSSSSLGSSGPSGTKGSQTSESGLSLDAHSSSSSYANQQEQQPTAYQKWPSQSSTRYEQGAAAPGPKAQASGGAERR